MLAAANMMKMSKIQKIIKGLRPSDKINYLSDHIFWEGWGGLRNRVKKSYILLNYFDLYSLIC